MAEKSGLKKEGGSAAFKQGEEKVLIIPLRKESRKSARNMRKNRAIREVKAFLSRHMKTVPSKVRVSQQLNESLWKGGLHNTPARIKVKVSSDEEGNVLARLLDEKEKPKAKKKSRLGIRERLAKRRESAAEEKPEPKEKDSGKKPVPPTSNEKDEKPGPAEKKPGPEKEVPKEAPPEEETLLEQ